MIRRKGGWQLRFLGQNGIPAFVIGHVVRRSRGLKLVGPLGIRDLSILHFSEEQTVVRHRYRPILIYLSDYHPMAWRVHL